MSKYSTSIEHDGVFDNSETSSTVPTISLCEYSGYHDEQGYENCNRKVETTIRRSNGATKDVCEQHARQLCGDDYPLTWTVDEQ